MPREVRRMRFTLYSTSACHLCEQAASMLQAWRDNGLGPEIEHIDIADDDELFERYGIRIPVLGRSDGKELGWPFDMKELGNFLAGEA
ncbi:MAG: glutaredoxin family protein [Pseudomonadota bacterium]